MNNDEKRAWEDAENDYINSKAWAGINAWKVFVVLFMLSSLSRFFHVEIYE